MRSFTTLLGGDVSVFTAGSVVARQRANTVVVAKRES